MAKSHNAHIFTANFEKKIDYWNKCLKAKNENITDIRTTTTKVCSVFHFYHHIYE